MKAHNPVVWFEIYVDDMQRAKKFYEAMLGIQLTELTNPTDDGAQMLAFPMEMESKNMASGALVKMEGMKPGGSGTVVYFYSDDCAKEQAKIADAGGKVVNEKMSLGEFGFALMAKDTEGNMFGVHSMG